MFVPAAALALLMLLLSAAACAETIKAGDIELTVRPDGCGLVDEVKFKGEVVVSTAATGNAPAPGFASVDADAAKRFADALKNVKADAPCKLSGSASAKGHKLITLENGLLKVTVLPLIGGRVLRLESKLTGRNFLDDPYEDRPDAVKEPKDIGGIWGELEDKIFDMKVVKETPDEIVLVLTSDDGEGKKIEKTLTLRRGSAALTLEQKQINIGEDAREAENHLFGRFLIGDATDEADTLWGSSRGRAEWFRRVSTSPDCHMDPRVDRWSALCDAKSGEALVAAHEGPVVRIGTWVQKDFYQFEWWTPGHFSLPAKGEMATKVNLAPVFNMPCVSYADANVAVGIMAASDGLIGADAPAWSTRVAGVSFDANAGRVTLKGVVHDINGNVVKTLPPVGVDCPFLVASMKEVAWPTDGLHAGRYELRIAIESAGKPLGATTLAFQRAAAGPIFERFIPTAEEAGVLFPTVGAAERGKVEVTSVKKLDERTIRVEGRHAFKEGAAPYAAEIKVMPEGDGFTITHTLTPGVSRGARIRAVALAVPLMLGNDQRNLKTTVGGDQLDDAWRMDQSDEGVYTMTISDYFSRWPTWRLGGVLQDSPTHFIIWKAGARDTAPTITVQGNKAPGWVDGNNRRWGVNIEVPDMAAKAPRGIVLDAEGGCALVHFYPPQAPPLAPGSSGDAAAPSRADQLGIKAGQPWTNVAVVRFQSGPHVRGFKREITDEAFRAFLEALGDPTVPRSLTTLGIARGDLEQCIDNIVDSDVSFRVYMERGVRGGSALRAACSKFQVNATNDLDATVDNLIKALNEKYK